MIFQHTHELVLSGSKTQTRRIVKPGDVELNGWRQPLGTSRVGTLDDIYTIGCVVNGKRTVYQKWNSYAVQPGRGQKSVGRIEITGIRREDVRQISEEDAIAEGFHSKSDFWYTWIEMHDKSWLKTFEYANDTDYLEEYGFYRRPADRYDAWVLSFRLVEAT